MRLTPEQYAELQAKGRGAKDNRSGNRNRRRLQTNPAEASVEYKAGSTPAQTSSTLEIKLSWPPTNNNLYTVARGRKILSEVGRSYRDTAIRDIGYQCCLGSHHDFGIKGPVEVCITAFPPLLDKRGRKRGNRFDLDNLLKMPLDCCVKAGAIEDDSKIQRLTIERGPATEVAHLIVRIMIAHTSNGFTRPT